MPLYIYFVVFIFAVYLFVGLFFAIVLYLIDRDDRPSGPRNWKYIIGFGLLGWPAIGFQMIKGR